MSLLKTCQWLPPALGKSGGYFHRYHFTGKQGPSWVIGSLLLWTCLSPLPTNATASQHENCFGSSLWMIFLLWSFQSLNLAKSCLYLRSLLKLLVNFPWLIKSCWRPISFFPAHCSVGYTSLDATLTFLVLR